VNAIQNESSTASTPQKKSNVQPLTTTKTAPATAPVFSTEKKSGPGQQQPLVDQLARNAPQPAPPKSGPKVVDYKAGVQQPPVAQPAKPPVAKPVVQQPAKPKPPVAPPAPKPPVAKPIAPADEQKHLKWASDKIAGMSDQIDSLVKKHTGKGMTFQHQQQFGLAAQKAMRDAITSGKSEVRVPVKVGGKTLYVVVRRKNKANLSHMAGDGWDVSVEE
jgi:hypothetical protein